MSRGALRLGVLAGAMLAAAAVPARADELLRGPHPMRADNEVSIHFGAGKGYGGWLGGPKLSLDYAYRLWVASWLDLHMSFQQNRCAESLLVLTPCQDQRSDAVEMIAGLKWKWRMDIPLVFEWKLGAGPVYVFPDSYKRALGLAGRGAAGGKYFLYDWFGVGAEVAASVGQIFHDAYYPGDHGYVTLDFAIGVEFQF